MTPPTTTPPTTTPPTTTPPTATSPAVTPPGGPNTSHPPRRDRGSVTAETAVLLPVLLIVLAAAVGVLACVASQLRCIDAARAAARVAARGDDAAVVRSTAERLAPPGARVTIGTTGDVVEVVIRAEVRPFGPALQGLGSIDVSGRAVAPVEGAAR